MAVVISTLAMSPFHASGAGTSPRGGGQHPGKAKPAAEIPSPSPSTAIPGGTAGGGGGAQTTLQRLIAAGEPIYCGAGTKPLVALTFDDGPGPDTLQTIATLRAAHMTATFFEVGKLLGENSFQGIPRSAARFGAVGDHTWSHVTMNGLSTSQLDAEIGRTRRALGRLTGTHVSMFRPPLGLHDGRVDTYVRSNGMLEILWSIDSQDSMGASADKIFRNVRDGLSAGDIILLHENRGTTQNALPRIIELIQQRGFQTVTVPELLAQDPPTAQQLRQHSCPG
jgi:peptidoglycan/xylan/chitin deacetylase (PgdA/CDA1 family)